MLGLLLSAGCVAAWGLVFYSVWRRPVTEPAKALSVKDEIDMLFVMTSVAPYGKEESADWREEEPLSTEDPHAITETDIKVQLATLAGDVKSQAREVSSIRTSVEREIGRMAQALEKHADIVTRAVDSIKAEFVNKAEWTATNERVKRVETVVYGAIGMIAIAVLGALIGTVVIK